MLATLNHEIPLSEDQKLSVLEGWGFGVWDYWPSWVRKVQDEASGCAGPRSWERCCSVLKTWLDKEIGLWDESSPIFIYYAACFTRKDLTERLQSVRKSQSNVLELPLHRRPPECFGKFWRDFWRRREGRH